MESCGSHAFISTNLLRSSVSYSLCNELGREPEIGRRGGDVSDRDLRTLDRTLLSIGIVGSK